MNLAGARPDGMRLLSTACLLLLQAGAALAAPPRAAPKEGAEPGEDHLRVLLAGLTLEQKIGQMIMSYPPKDKVAPVAVGSVVLTRDLLRSSEGVRALIDDLQRRATTPLLVAVDMEGGRLNRLKILAGFENVPSAYELGKADAETALDWGRRVGRGMRSLGMNCNLAPVLDVADRGVMHDWKRSLGSDVDKVSRIGRAYAEGLWEGGVVPIAKHYPGYGSLDKNTDYHVVVDRRSREEMDVHEKPFHQAGTMLGGVLMANVAYALYGGMPAILSGELVQKAHAQGWMTVTDDLAVGALSEAIGGQPEDVVRRAFLAGNDVLLTTAPIDWEKALDYRKIILELVRGQPSLESRIDESVLRLLRVKQRLGLLKPGIAVGKR